MMKKLDVEGLKKYQLNILDAVASFCKENNINYWLDSGTMIGAVRHHGYIPWDDDIDLGMLRPDYIRFMKLFNEHNSRYKAFCYENNHDFYYAFGKVLDTNTILYEPDEKGIKIAVNIDVFVYDNAPDDDKIVKKMFDLRDRYQYLSRLRTLNNIPRGNVLRKLAVYAGRLIVKPFPIDYFVKKKVENARKFTTEKTKRIGNFTSDTRFVCDRHVVDSFIDAEFEGKQYKIPIGYDEWLTNFYGNYMELPPLKERVSHHKFVAYVKE